MIESQDYGPTGEADRVVVVTYNDEDQTTREEIDENADGKLDQTTQWIYEPDSGRLSQVLFDEDGDGVIDLTLHSYYNEYGGRIREEAVSAEEIISIVHWYFDQQQFLVRKEWDENADSIPDTIHEYSYSAEGYMIRIEYDDNGDMSLNRVDSLIYDGIGNLIRREIDLRNDGALDSVRLYDWVGSLLIRYRVDRRADGVFDSIITYKYDMDGREILSETDQGADGQVDDWTLTHYNEDGTVAEVVLYRDREWHDTLAHDYGADGRIRESRFDSASFGRWVKTYSYTCSRRAEQGVVRYDVEGVAVGKV